MGSRANHHLRSAFLCELLMWNGALHYWYADKILLSVVNTLRDGFLHFLSLTETMSYHASAIAYNYEGREGECAATLCCFHNTVDGHHFVSKLQLAALYFI